MEVKYMTVFLTFTLVSISFAYDPGLNVKDFGATGNGINDDTAAVINAINAGKSQKLPVYFPQGSYKITQPLNIDAQSIAGIESGGWNADSCPMARLGIAHNTGSALTMYNGASIHGICFDYEGQNPTKAAIQLSGVGLSISNVQIRSCYEGIIADGTSNIGRVNIENVFIIQPKSTAVYITNTFDISALRNIEVWNNNPTMLPGPGFKFGKNDLIQCSNLTAFNLGVAFKVISAGGTWGTFSDCSSDNCSTGWEIEGTPHNIVITGGTHWNHWFTFLINAPDSWIQISNVQMKTNGGPSITVSDGKTVNINACNIGRIFNATNAYMVEINGGESLTLSNCHFDEQSPVIKIAENASQVLIANNIFQPSTYNKLDISPGPGSDILISNNIGVHNYASTVSADLNANGVVNFSDFAIFSQQWMAGSAPGALVSRLEFSEGTGTTVYDSVRGTTADIKYDAGPVNWLVPGNIPGCDLGNALSLDKADHQYISTDAPSGLLDSFAWTGWVKPVAPYSDSTIGIVKDAAFYLRNNTPRWYIRMENGTIGNRHAKQPRVGTQIGHTRAI